VQEMGLPRVGIPEGYRTMAADFQVRNRLVTIGQISIVRISQSWRSYSVREDPTNDDRQTVTVCKILVAGPRFVLITDGIAEFADAWQDPDAGQGTPGSYCLPTFPSSVDGLETYGRAKSVRA
jgi:hypothetical protein